MKITAMIAAVFFGLFSPADDPFDRTKSGQLNLTVEQTTNVAGTTRVLLFNNFNDPYLPEAAAFMKIDQPVGENTVSYTSIPYGDYIVLSYIDVNGNGVLDRTFFGDPREPWGISSKNGDAITSATYSSSAVVSFTEHNQNLAINIHAPLVKKSKQVKGAVLEKRNNTPELTAK